MLKMHNDGDVGSNPTQSISGVEVIAQFLIEKGVRAHWIDWYGFRAVEYGRYIIYTADGEIRIRFGHHGQLEVDLTSPNALEEMWEFINELDVEEI